MLTSEQAQRIASLVLSEKVSQMTVVPHDEGRMEENDQTYVWHALHLPQAGVFLIVRRPVSKKDIEFISFNSVIALVRATSDLKLNGTGSNIWRPLD